MSISSDPTAQPPHRLPAGGKRRRHWRPRRRQGGGGEVGRAPFGPGATSRTHAISRLPRTPPTPASLLPASLDEADARPPRNGGNECLARRGRG
ncbi:hypothetical protein I4F81_006994 [Pyropia yezoensis]|uniref:Uncharacterized protein n=1 Tax=Pyropia yezoensis TaxID=2788 RepID=A0ACC3C3K8_PYRYE|nr:hypothetical protein I4F81_006994 [Neopyropia yezoensis]